MEKQLVPKLRFPEFEGKWEAKKLKNIADIKRGAGSQYINYVEKKEKTSIRLIRIGDFLSSDPVWIQRNDAIERFILKENDILIAGTGATAGITFKVPNDFIGMAFSYNAPKISCIKNVSSSFIVEYLKSTIITSQQKRLFTGNAQPFLDTKAINNFKINLPTLPEQQKIASFLTSVDKRIQALEQKKDLLKQYKKGVMQKIFKQEIRFKDDDGKEFPAWEKKNGNLLFKSNSNKNHNSDLPILAVTQDQGAIPRDMIDYNIGVTAKSVSSYKVVHKGDFIISLRSFQGGIEYSNYEGICSPAYIILRPIKELNRDFYKFYLKTPSYIQELTKKLEGIRDGKMISYKYFSEIKLPYPCLEEQAKIANFLSAIDKKIELTNQQIDHSKTFKKGLLQKMFV